MFFRSIREFYFLKYNFFFSQHIITEIPSLEKENITKNAIDIFRLGKLKTERLMPQLNV